MASCHQTLMIQLCTNYISGRLPRDSRFICTDSFRPFADAVKAGVGAVMCSYNQINNSYGCQNSWNLNRLLKGELDFQGFGTFLCPDRRNNYIFDNISHE